jgi:hypothetical protein
MILQRLPLLSLLAALATLHLLALGLFSSGFLLSRVEITTRSSCANSGLKDSSSHVYHTKASDESLDPWQEGCWGSKHFSKTIWVVIDALRLDFVTCNPGGSGTDTCTSRMPKLLQLSQSSVKPKLLSCYLLSANHVTLSDSITVLLEDALKHC